MFQPSNFNDMNRNMLVQQGGRKIQDVFIREFKKDELNPLKRQTVKKLITIDSLFREKYDMTTSTDYIHTFREPLKNVVSMKISNIEIPNIWYFFSDQERDNEFRITVRSAKTTAGVDIPIKTYTVKIPEGNYSYDMFRITMNNLFINADTNNNSLACLVVALENTTGRVIIRANDDTTNGRPTPFVNGSPSYSPNFKFTIDFNIPDLKRNIRQNMGWKMGFRKATYTVTGTDTFQDARSQEGIVTYYSYLRSEGMYGSSLNRYIYFSIDDYQNNYQNSISGDNKEYYIEDSILGRITVTAISNAIMVNNGADYVFKERNYFGPVRLEKIRIRVLNRFGEVINLNSNDFSIALEITQLYS